MRADAGTGRPDRRPGFPPLVRLEEVTKSFPGVVANDRVTFEVRPGEVHALLGENGAGKTTLVNVLYGLYRPDSGFVLVNGRRVTIRSPREAIALGIGMVHQHFKLVLPHTVAENAALGLKGTPFWAPARGVGRRLLELSERYGLPVDPDRRVWELSAGEQQRVEILKALLRGAEVLILDEPTSVLTPQETGELFKVLSRMREEGHGVIFISHKLTEVLEVADRITVMRRGRVVGTVAAAGAEQEQVRGGPARVPQGIVPGDRPGLVGQAIEAQAHVHGRHRQPDPHRGGVVQGVQRGQADHGWSCTASGF